MKVIDLHQDILYHQRGEGGVVASSQTSFDKLSDSEVQLVSASVFIDPEEFGADVFGQRIDADLFSYWKKLVGFIRCGRDVERLLGRINLSLLLHIEGLYVPWSDDVLPQLKKWYVNYGLRSLGIVWNHSNDYGGGCSEPGVGLSAAGREVLGWCEKYGVLIDLAHMNEATFWDALDAVDGLVMVSHGNAAAVRTHRRNLSDEQLRAVAARGGVVGVNFVRGFLVDGDRATVADVAEHVEHIRDCAGLSCVAVGSDFGGVLDGGVEGLQSVEDFPSLWMELRRRGWSEDDIECVAWRNAGRVIGATLG